MSRNAAMVELKGTPNRLATILHLPDEGLDALRHCSVRLSGVAIDRAHVRAIRGTTSGASVLKIKLPHNTPPGSYEGVVQVGNTELPITVDVQVHRDLRLFPSSLSADVSPGSVVTTTVSAHNAGNTAVKIEQQYKFCIFDPTGIDRALYLALATDQPKGEKRIDRLMDELAEAHGGRVRLDVESGAEEIAAGETRQLKIALHFSDRLRPGLIYAGSWTVENADYAVEIKAIAKA